MVDKASALWQYLSPEQQGLIQDADYLFQKAEEETVLHDYSFLIFPFAKVYEGFLKKLFLDLGFIDQHQYRSDRFRIGKALNPELEPHLRHESIYDKLTAYCRGEDLANELWNVWKKGRNLLFHYFPHNVHALSLPQAKETRDAILQAMEYALTSCITDRKDVLK